MDDDSVLVEQDLSMSIITSIPRGQYSNLAVQTAQSPSPLSSAAPSNSITPRRGSEELPDWYDRNILKTGTMTSQHDGIEDRTGRCQEIPPRGIMRLQDGM